MLSAWQINSNGKVGVDIMIKLPLRIALLGALIGVSQLAIANDIAKKTTKTFCDQHPNVCELKDKFDITNIEICRFCSDSTPLDTLQDKYKLADYLKARQILDEEYKITDYMNQKMQLMEDYPISANLEDIKSLADFIQREQFLLELHQVQIDHQLMEYLKAVKVLDTKSKIKEFESELISLQMDNAAQ